MVEIRKNIPNPLGASQKYAVRVRAVNSFGLSSQWSEAIAIDTEDYIGTPPFPLNLTAIASYQSVILSWTPVPILNLAYYEIFVNTGSADFTPNTNRLIVRQSGGSLAVVAQYWNGNARVSMLADTAYSFKMRTVDTSGNVSDFTPYVSVTTSALGASGGSATILGTTNEIEVTYSGSTPTIGLPNNVSVSGTFSSGALATLHSLTVNNNSTLANLTVTGDLIVNGTTTTINSTSEKPD
jgi:hypothetical protein